MSVTIKAIRRIGTAVQLARFHLGDHILPVMADPLILDSPVGQGSYDILPALTCVSRRECNSGLRWDFERIDRMSSPVTTSSPQSTASAAAGTGEQAHGALVVLCTYNEIENLPKMFALITEHLPGADILVVDDSSPDGTAQWVRDYAQRTESDDLKSPTDLGVHLLLRPGKLGLGTALRDAIKWCLDNGNYEYLLNFDADVSHHPRYAMPMLQMARSSETDVVVGTRYRSGGKSPGLPWHRKIISRCLNAYALRLLRLPISDCSGSFRCYRTSKLRELNLSQLRCPGYGFLEEILVALKNQDATFGEVPIVFDSRYAGESKLSLGDAFGAIKTIHRLALTPPA